MTAVCTKLPAGVDVKLPFAMTGPKQPRGEGSRWQRSSRRRGREDKPFRAPPSEQRRTHRGAATAAGHVNSRHARSSVGHRSTAEGWGPAQSRCRKGLRRSLAGVLCALDTGWVVQMAVLDRVLGERGADRNLAIEFDVGRTAIRAFVQRRSDSSLGRRLEISVIEDDEERCR